jgi:hypothetical protein
MRYFLDTEFIEDGRAIDLISIGIVAEDGRELYLINEDCDFSKASGWVKEHVIAQLPPNPSDRKPWHVESSSWVSRDKIADEVANFTGCTKEPYLKIELPSPSLTQKIKSFFQLQPIPLTRSCKYTFAGEKADRPEFWAYYADYDWVVFAQLFGTMMDLPKGFPMYCRDIKQWCDMLGNPKLPEQGKGKHNALADAHWNKRAWEFLDDLSKKD